MTGTFRPLFTYKLNHSYKKHKFKMLNCFFDFQTVELLENLLKNCPFKYYDIIKKIKKTIFL